MVFFSSAVVGFCGIGFIGERAEVYPFAVDADSCPPAFHVLCPVDSFEPRTRLDFELSSVPDVLRVRYRSDVCFSVVEAVMVYVVGEHAGGDVDDEVVHVHIPSGQDFAVCQRPDGVKCVFAIVGIPFVFS